MIQIVNDVVDFFIGEKQPMNVDQLSALYVRECVSNPMWAKATYQEVEAAIREAGRLGKVTIIVDTVWPAKVQTVAAPEQLELF